MEKDFALAWKIAQLWREIVPDLADWTLRCENLVVRMCGVRCTRAALARHLEWNAALPQSPEPPILPLALEEVLSEMADAEGPQQYFSSILLFVDPMAHEAATQAGFEFSELFHAAEKEAIFRRLGMDEEALGLAYRWSGHLEDILASAGGLDSSRPASGENQSMNYQWPGGLPPTDAAYFRWADRDEMDEKARTVLAGEMALLALFENWPYIAAEHNDFAHNLTRILQSYEAVGHSFLDDQTPNIRNLNPNALKNFLTSNFTRREAIVTNLTT